MDDCSGYRPHQNNNEMAPIVAEKKLNPLFENSWPLHLGGLGKLEQWGMLWGEGNYCATDVGRWSDCVQLMWMLYWHSLR